MGILERKEREREARRTTILDAAERVFKMKGFTNATMDDIAREAELAKGTVYLYYRSKEELQIGLLNRGVELLYETFQRWMEGKPTAIEKILTAGLAYWQFAEEHLFYFSLMNLVDLPNKSGQVSEDALVGMQERSNAIWSLLVGELERAKQEGTIKPEVSSLAVAMLLWVNASSVLRFHNRLRATPDSVWSEQEAHFNPCNMDWRALYELNANLLLHEVVTLRGMMYLRPIVWPDNLNAGAASVGETYSSSVAYELAPFVDEDIPLFFHETGV